MKILEQFINITLIDLPYRDFKDFDNNVNGFKQIHVINYKSF